MCSVVFGFLRQKVNNRSVISPQEYDIVFNVEIEEGKPPLKLPFNLTGIFIT